MNLSPHFTLEEACFSDTAIRLGIVNQPSERVLANMQRAASHMEVVREVLDRLPILVHSWYRCPALNIAVKGSEFSDHMDGWAVDWTCPRFGSPLDIIKALSEELSSFDQLIYEGTWVHSSFSPKLRKEVLTAHFGAKTSYTKGIAAV